MMLQVRQRHIIPSLFTLHVQHDRGKVIGVSVHIYIYIGIFVDKKNLNRTLAINSLFQTFVVGLLVEFID